MEATESRLPDAYIHQMTQQLGLDEAMRFLSSYEDNRTYGLRINPLKVTPSIAASIKETFHLREVPWCETGYYYDPETKPGKHPYHTAGIYYIQEPSAMSAAELLSPEPGDLVLDLAAAPGGKSTQIAGKLSGRGLLVANEIHPVRAKALSENIERCGIRNAVVVSASPQELEKVFPQYFDKIMLDAPCSGEGMFRKDAAAIQEWSPKHVEMCASRQMDILHAAVRMLKPGGLLAYSTCTFNVQENEETMDQLLTLYPQLSLLKTERFWPHLQEGEGHFVALLRLTDEIETGHEVRKPAKAVKHAGKPELEAFAQYEQFAREQFSASLPEPQDGYPLLFGNQLYWMPSGGRSERLLTPDKLHGLKVLRPGLHLAELKKNRIEPAHALAASLTSKELASAARQYLLQDDSEANKYLRGEALTSLDKQLSSGWTVVSFQGTSLGWGKYSEGQLKNHYPKGLRV